MAKTKILTYDSTLRDGEQCEGIALSLEDKLRIVQRLDQFGIDFIEGGFPASNPKDVAFFQQVQQLGLKHAQIAAFGSTCRKGVPATEDQGLADLLACGAPVVTIVGKTWDAQVERALRTTLEENLRMILRFGSPLEGGRAARGVRCRALFRWLQGKSRIRVAVRGGGSVRRG